MRISTSKQTDVKRPSRIGAGIAAACLVTNALPAAPRQAAPLAGPLRGEWVSDCTPIGRNGRHGHIIRLVITRDSIAATGQLYAANTCDSPTIRGEYLGKLLDVRARGERLELDYEFSDAAFTLQREDVVSYYNNGYGCGLKGWQLDVPKSVVGKRCPPIDVPPSGQKMFESAWVAGDQLRFGAFPLDTSNRSPEARPEHPRPLIFRRVTSSSKTSAKR